MELESSLSPCKRPTCPITQPFHLQNHFVWAREPPEPAFLKLWLRGGLLQRSGAALRAEEGGMSQVVLIHLHWPRSGASVTL